MKKCMNKISILIFIVSWLSFSGCTTIIDNVPEGHPKGYVEFTLENKNFPPPKQISIWEGRQKTGYLDSFGLKVAKIPGKYFFSAALGDADEKFSVSVVEGMITPVKIVYDQISVTDDLFVGYGPNPKRAYRFNLNYFVGNPRPPLVDD